MNDEIYLKKLKEDISKIVKNITINDEGHLLDDGYEIKEKIKDYIGDFDKFSLDQESGILEKNEFLLINWIYNYYYQNRNNDKIESNPIFDQIYYPFNNQNCKLGFENQYWRSRFWRYDDKENIDVANVILTHGYETRSVMPQQFAEDELVFDSNDKYLSMIFPKFEVQENVKFVYGKYPIDDDLQGGIIRFYFNLNPKALTEAIPLIIKLFNVYFNDRLIPFHFKFCSKTVDFKRADNLVLYIERRHFFIAGFLLKHIYNQIANYIIKERLPLFVREVLPGIGFSKSPQKDEISFGVMRSQIIAKKILEKLQNPTFDVIESLKNKWGDLIFFYLNPKPSFKYSFEIFNPNKDTLLTTSLFQDEVLDAAFYIAKLLCREAIWLSSNTCNWMSYRILDSKIENEKTCYRLLDLDTGYKGIEGVILFLEAFQKIGIRDSIIEFVCESGVNLLGKSKNSSFIKPDDFKSSEFRNEIVNIIENRTHPLLNNSPFLRRLIEEHISQERPLNNMIDGGDDFCPDLQFGLAGYGYALLRIYSPDKVPPLPEGTMISNKAP